MPNPFTHIFTIKTMALNTDFNIPLNVIQKIILESVTEDISVQEDFVKALSRATSLFILYSSSKASDVASENNRRSVYAQDVIAAVTNLGCNHLVPELIDWHSAFLEEKENLKNTKKKKPTDESDGKQETE